MSKEATVFAVDVGPSMVKQLKDGDGNSYTLLDAALKIVEEFTKSKLLFSKRDEIGVIAFGQLNNENPLKEVGYEFIDIHSQIRIPNLADLENIEKLRLKSSSKRVESDPINALLAGMKLLTNRVGKYKFKKRAFVITACAGKIKNPEELQGIAEKCQFIDFELNIIALVDPKSASSIQLKNFEILEEFCKNSCGNFIHSIDGHQLLAGFRKRPIRPTPKYKGYFEISSKLKLNVIVYGKTMKQGFPLLTKLSQPAIELNVPYKDAGVKMARSYLNKFSENPEDLTEDRRVKSYQYGKSLIPFSKIDENILQYKSTPCLSLLGFARSIDIPRDHFMSGSDIVIANPEDEKTQRAFGILVEALFEKDFVAIVRFVKRLNSEPILGCMSPWITNSSMNLVLNQLPFEEDFRDYCFHSILSDSKFKPSDKQLDATKNFIQCLDLDKNEDQSGCFGQSESLMQPENTFNPVIQRFYDTLENKALLKNHEIKPPDKYMSEYLKLRSSQLTQFKAEISNFEDVFELMEIVDKKQNDKRHWRELVESNDDIMAPKAVRIKKDEEESSQKLLSMMDLFSSTVSEIRDVDPVFDFHQMIRSGDKELESKALLQIWDVIKRLIRNGFQSSKYPMAVECLSAVRGELLGRNDLLQYNSKIRELKSSISEHQWWEYVQMHEKDRLKPFSSSDDPRIPMTSEEASSFFISDFDSNIISKSNSIPALVEDEEDSLWDEI